MITSHVRRNIGPIKIRRRRMAGHIGLIGAADRRRALRIGLSSAAIGSVAAVLAMLLPI